MGLKTAIVILALLLPIRPVGGQSIDDANPTLSDDLDRESLRDAMRRSVTYLEKLPPDRVVGEQPRRFTAKEILDVINAFEKTLGHWECGECWLKRIRAGFDFVPSSRDPELENVLFTGYYQPVIDGSLTQTAEFRYPIYGQPSDLIVAEQVKLTPTVTTEKIIGRVEEENFVPYHSRRDIDEKGILRGRGYEIAWLKDPIDVFFLHIQGSGIIRLPDGKEIKVGYAAQNGRPYRSIGRLLIDNGKVPREEMSMQRLRQYLTEHPEERDEILAYNESYVFFRVLDDGPLGSLEVPLTSGRSIATDSRIFPKGALGFVMTQRPVLDGAGNLVGWRPFARFVLNQDTGGAIRGLQRVDLFWGTGDQAAAEAGYMNSQGKLYFLSLKNSASNGQSSR